ncbi:MAG: SWIM zinc finger family protein [Verrucomicrobiota bacterium]|jgi:hypothetical protein
MSTPGHFKIACANCQGHIEFPKELHGQTIDCPHCGLSTVLRVPGFVESLPTPAPTAPISLDQPPSIAQTPQIQDDTINPAPQLGLPEITDESFRSTKVRSQDGTNHYTVNLIDYTCTCPSFLEVHSKAPPRDYGRICKHICAELNRHRDYLRLDPICRAIVQEGYGIYPGRFDRDKNGNLIYITGANSTGWLNVFALKRIDGKTYYRFGYNLKEGRWAYGSFPKIKEEILYPKSSSEFSKPISSGLGWRIFWGVINAVGKAVGVIPMVLFGLVVGLLSSGKKSRRRRF